MAMTTQRALFAIVLGALLSAPCVTQGAMAAVEPDNAHSSRAALLVHTDPLKTMRVPTEDAFEEAHNGNGSAVAALTALLALTLFGSAFVVPKRNVRAQARVAMRQADRVSRGPAS